MTSSSGSNVKALVLQCSNVKSKDTGDPGFNVKTMVLQVKRDDTGILSSYLRKLVLQLLI
jgi:hypothetical protein